MRREVTIRPSIAADFEEIDRPLPFRVKAFTGLVDGRVIGVGGIGTYPNGAREAFTYLTNKARSYPVALHKLARRVLEQARQDGIKEVFAFAEDDLPAAERWLERLGFQMQQIDGKKVWLWHS